ncbi:MAG: hypothetical protein ACR2N7_02645 [Acidimicrobiia bacterium]
MRSELLYSTDQAYIDSTMEYVELHEGAYLQMYGRGNGRVDWAGTPGSIEWTNFPPRRPDGIYLPDITGVIKLVGSEHSIMYRMNGISLSPDEHGQRLFAGPVRWITDHPDFLWLNDRWGYEEGALDANTLGFVTKAYVLHPEPPG